VEGQQVVKGQQVVVVATMVTRVDGAVGVVEGVVEKVLLQARNSDQVAALVYVS
jgi:hypothetical protein